MIHECLAFGHALKFEVPEALSSEVKPQFLVASSRSVSGGLPPFLIPPRSIERLLPPTFPRSVRNLRWLD